MVRLFSLFLSLSFFFGFNLLASSILLLLCHSSVTDKVDKPTIIVKNEHTVLDSFITYSTHTFWVHHNRLLLLADELTPHLQRLLLGEGLQNAHLLSLLDVVGEGGLDVSYDP